jgi:hypothetical protein
MLKVALLNTFLPCSGGSDQAAPKIFYGQFEFSWAAGPPVESLEIRNFDFRLERVIEYQQPPLTCSYNRLYNNTLGGFGQ